MARKRGVLGHRDRIAEELRRVLGHPTTSQPHDDADPRPVETTDELEKKGFRYFLQGMQDVPEKFRGSGLTTPNPPPPTTFEDTRLPCTQDGDDVVFLSLWALEIILTKALQVTPGDLIPGIGREDIFKAELGVGPVRMSVLYRLMRDRSIKLMQVDFLEESEVQASRGKGVTEGRGTGQEPTGSAEQAGQSDKQQPHEKRGPQAYLSQESLPSAVAELRRDIQAHRDAILTAFAARLKQLTGWRGESSEENAAVAEAIRVEARDSGIRLYAREGDCLVPVSIRFHKGLFELTRNGGKYFGGSDVWPELIPSRRGQVGKK